MRKIFKVLILTLSLMGTMPSYAQAVRDSVAFSPHWYLLPQIGVSYHTGEAKFDKLLTPAAAISLGRQFNPLFGLRVGASGWQARNRIAYPKAGYKWNFIQTNLDVTVSLSNLIAGYKYNRPLNVYAFLGGGVNYAFNNNDAVKLYNAGMNLGEIWKDHKLFPTARGGIGADFRLSEGLALNMEANANILPDKFNSKKGKNSNIDCQANLMIGLRIALGKTTRHIIIEEVPEPIEPVVEMPVKEVKVEEPIKEPIVEEVKKEPVKVETFFRINSSKIFNSQTEKLDSLAQYLKEHPEVIVNITGYADKQTGTHTYNLKLSNKRAIAIRDYLWWKGIPYEQMNISAKGDTEQPNPTAKENRVTICITNE